MPQRAIGPIRVSEDGRYFVDQNREPFFWLGDTQWELFLRFNDQEAERICENRKNKGFSVLQIMILGVDGGTKPNVFGELPFLNDNPLTPNERYFAHVDSVVEMADRNALVCVIGVYHKSDDCGKLITLANARPWARWVGRRYERYPNIIWSMYPEAKDSYTAIAQELAAGLQEGDGGRHIITVHPDPAPASSSELWHNEGWLAFNTLQVWLLYSDPGFHNGTGLFSMTRTDYEEPPPKPTVMGEGGYEGLQSGRTNTPLEIRKQAWWSYLAGGHHTYGHNDNWSNPSAWKSWIDSPGACHMTAYRRIVTSIPRWWAWIPDQSILADSPGTGPTLNAAARSDAGDWILAYIASPTVVTIEMDKIAAGTADAFWINPKTGDRALIGSRPARGRQSFTTPAGWDDAVLLLSKPNNTTADEL